MSLRACEDGLPLFEPPGYPQRFEVRHGAAAGKMTQMFVPTKHCGDLRYGFLLHGRRSASPIKRVIVGIDPLRQSVGKPRYRVWRLKHLPGIERMEVRKIVVKAFGRFRDHRTDSYHPRRLRVVRREGSKHSIQFLKCFT